MFARGFLGVVPTSLIETIVDICKPQEWPAVHVACSGTFRTERGLLNKFPKLEVHSNDVSLLSTALGMAGSGKRLDYRFVGELAWIEDHGLTAVEDRIAAILLALTYSSFAKGKANRFKTAHIAHMREHFGEYVEKTRDVIIKTLKAMPITGYFPGDFRDHVEHAIERRAGVIAYPPTFCLASHHRILTSSLDWVPCGDIREGDQLIAFDEYPVGNDRNRRWRRSVVTTSFPSRKECVRVILDNGEEIVCTVDHPWLADRYQHSGGNGSRAWIRADQLTVSGRPYVLKAIEPWVRCDSFEAGWLSGLFDGEGHFRWRRDARDGSAHLGMTVVQKPGVVLDRALELLDSLAIGCGETQERKTGICALDVQGGFPGIARALGRIRPVRLLNKFNAQGLDDWAPAIRVAVKPRVVAVEPIGERDVQSISTSTRTYVGEGYLMHNTGGYEKLFEFIHSNVEWQAPDYRLFDPSTDVLPVLQRLEESGIPYFLYLDQEIEGFEPKVRMKARGKRDIFGYGRAKASSWRTVQSHAKAFAYEPVHLDRLRPDSVLSALPAPESYITFLREAFLKRGIAFGSGDYGALVFLDDMLVGCISYRKPMSAGQPLLVLTDLVITREGRLAKLVARLATHRDVIRPLERKQLVRYDQVSTIVFSDHPESMKYRGSWKVHTREEVNALSGKYKLSYRAAVRTESFADCYAWWWKRDGEREVAAARSRAQEAGSQEPQAA
jgi:hypothetical protein